MKMTPTPNSTRIGFSRKFILVGLIGLAAARLLAAAPEARTVTLTDYLGVDWKDELVHFAIELPKGALKGAATAEVKAADGKAVPCQAGEVLKHDDGSIRSFNIWFLVDLPANQSASFTISPGKRGTEDDGVTVKATEASIEFTTKAPQKIGIRLLGGAKEFNPPVPATGVPGPISALLLPSCLVNPVPTPGSASTFIPGDVALGDAAAGTDAQAAPDASGDAQTAVSLVQVTATATDAAVDAAVGGGVHLAAVATAVLATGELAVLLPDMRNLIVVHGAITVSSWSRPIMLAPFLSSTPTTRKATFCKRIS